jgi:hypothetical protein
MLSPNRLDTEAVLRVGEVSGVTGRRILISVDTDKNLSELFFDGDVLRNIAVGSYIDIRKGFVSLIGKVEGENARGDDNSNSEVRGAEQRRVLTVALVGFLDHQGRFFGGTKELPLVGNEAFLLTKEKIHQVHCLVSPAELMIDLDWHNNAAECRLNQTHYLKQDPSQIKNTFIYDHVKNFEISNDAISDLLAFAYIQLIYDVLSNRAQNEHIAPAINKLKSKQADIRKLFDPGDHPLFEKNVVVIALGDVNLEMRKTVPLLLAKKIYDDHKQGGKGRSLNIIIDEAHNILSQESFRESESWKDYRLETFEEIIKEGRKFGVFVTISSQRPNDISHTITSQAHNYFIHRLINQKDLQSIASAVSYIDKLTEESIPTLPTGTCIFSGIAGQMPLKLEIFPLEEKLQPRSSTLQFKDIVPLE